MAEVEKKPSLEDSAKRQVDVSKIEVGKVVESGKADGILKDLYDQLKDCTDSQLRATLEEKIRQFAEAMNPNKGPAPKAEGKEAAPAKGDKVAAAIPQGGGNSPLMSSGGSEVVEREYDDGGADKYSSFNLGARTHKTQEVVERAQKAFDRDQQDAWQKAMDERRVASEKQQQEKDKSGNVR